MTKGNNNLCERERERNREGEREKTGRKLLLQKGIEMKSSNAKHLSCEYTK